MDLPEAERKAVEENLVRELRTKVRRGLFALTGECLGSPSVTILSALGIDAEEKLLQIFLEEINQILNQPT